MDGWWCTADWSRGTIVEASRFRNGCSTLPCAVRCAWRKSPSEVRQQMMQLLARMLNEQAERRLASPSLREASDE